ncbi:interferon gamma receptor 2 [Danio aesculapii]|uniref:interferon gamma receptor 2 n=1 Tax=Danio aesculapii TaxID=1142201 RepID=UPI0024BF8B2A|nr:interferon gamma receptor 2 [Danio aesculapii]XP_056314340.1 interferon gamma receptor 2 [Danio aesculapii]XP_056314341.1 interferon gamma receptor 2 [Danio aesculapii]
MTFIIQLTIFTLIINIERTCCLNPPQDLKIVKSQLLWKPPEVDGDLQYFLQYTLGSKAEDEWYNVSSLISKNAFNITDEFYGALFRVRAEKGNHISEWAISNRVNCVNVNSCAPVVTPSAKPGIVSLTLAHMDQSLEKEHGDHLEFNILSWNVNSRENPEEGVVINSKDYIFDDLESGQNYCFQVEYLLYHKPYGKASEKICVFIPETPEAKKTRVLIYATLSTLFVLMVCSFCIFLFRKYKRNKRVQRLVKEWFQPLKLELPDHYIEFLSSEFPVGLSPSPSVPSLQSDDFIVVTENTSMEENGQEKEQ